MNNKKCQVTHFLYFKGHVGLGCRAASRSQTWEQVSSHSTHDFREEGLPSNLLCHTDWFY